MHINSRLSCSLAQADYAHFGSWAVPRETPLPFHVGPAVQSHCSLGHFFLLIPTLKGRFRTARAQRQLLHPPSPCPSMPKVRKTTVRQAHVLRKPRACTQYAVPKERMSPKTCPYLTLTTIFATGHYNTMCRQISASSGGPHCPSGPSAVVQYKPFPTLRLILNNCTCLPFEAGFGAGLASGFGKGLGFLLLGTKLSSAICFVK